MSQPSPFEIATGADGVRVASNGERSMTVLEGEAELFRRRAIKRAALSKPPAELAIPALNELASELLGRMDMPAADVAARLRQLADQVEPVAETRIEWAVARLDGVYAYFDGSNVVVTRQDLTP